MGKEKLENKEQEQTDNATKTATQQNANHEKDKENLETKTKADETKVEETKEKSELELLREEHTKLIMALNDRTLGDVLAETKIDPTKKEWVRKINADMFKGDSILDTEKLKTILNSKEYDSIRVFNGLEAKSTLSNVFTSNQQIKSNPQVDAKTKEKQEWTNFISKYKKQDSSQKQ